MTKEQRYIGW